MKCKKCGRRIPHGDKYCVYCGSTTGFLPLRFVHGWIGRLPVWVRLTGAATSLFIIGFLITFLLISKHTTLTPTPTPQPTLTHQSEKPLTSFQLKESANLSTQPPTVNSKYTSSAPTVDGIITPGEWTEPTFTKTFDYSIGNISKVGELVGYFMNDDDNLYVAITVSAEDFHEDIFDEFEKEGVGFALELRFDGDNDNIVTEREDVRTIGRDFYDNLNLRHFEYNNGSFCSMSGILLCGDGNTNGAGNMSYPGDTNTFTYEFSIPLNSGNPGDLAVKPGDTVGLKVILGERQTLDGSYRVLESVGWPIGGGVLDGSTYGKLVLALAQQPPGPRLKWNYEIGGNITSSPAIGADGIIYVASQEGKLYAINPNGTLKWVYDTAIAIKEVVPWRNYGSTICGAPVIGADGTIYVAFCDGPILVLNAEGLLLRSYTSDVFGIRDSPVLGSDGTIYVSSYEGAVRAFNTDGSVKWSYPRKSDFTTDFYESPVLGDDGTIYAISREGKLYAIYEGGLLKWVYDAECRSDFSPAVGKDGTVYVNCLFGDMRAIDSKGILKWSCNCGGMGSSPLVAQDGTIYTTCSDGLVKIDINGNVEWKFSADKQTDQSWINTDQSQIAISDKGIVYMVSHQNVESYSEGVGGWQLSDLGSRLDAFTLNGLHKWTYNMEKPGQHSLAIDTDGTIYLCSEDGILYAFEDSQ